MEDMDRTGLKDEAEREALFKSLGGVEYPEELDPYLKYFDREAKQNGWPIAVIKAYCLGFINGKRDKMGCNAPPQ